MMEKKYHVVFSGEIAEGQSDASVRQRMAALFKTSPAGIDALFAKKTAAIKKNVDQETAQKYVAALKRAGAVCRIIPAESTPSPSPAHAAAPPAKPVVEEKPRQEGPRVITIPMINKSEPEYAPRVVGQIAGTSSGLTIDEMDRPEIPFNHVFAVTVFTQNDKGNEINKLLMFIHSVKQPCVCAAPNIRYADFSLDNTAKPAAAFRSFLYFLCRKNPALFLDENTFDFLSGSQPPKLDDTGLLKLATGLGKLIESGQIASQT